MKQILIISLVLLLAAFPLAQAEVAVEEDEFAEFSEQTTETDETNESAADSDDEGGFEETDFAEEGDDAEMAEETQPQKDSFVNQWISPARITVKHESSYRTSEPEQVVNNRSSIRLEYAKSIGTYFFVQLDTKINLYWADDHRAQADDADYLPEGNTKEAFLQSSFGNTSIKAGYQVLIWGESELGAITDIVSPRDSSEFLFIPLEESRIGQAMLIIEQFSPIGDWQMFYIPTPSFDHQPEEGTAYYVDPFAAYSLVIETDSTDDALHEYGLRWKKTFGKSDIALMAASLIDNNKSFRFNGFTPLFQLKMKETTHRFEMIGLTFNYAMGNFLWKGELAQKSPRVFINQSFTQEERVVTDGSFGLEYSPGGRYTLALEGSNSHIAEWSEDLVGVSSNQSVGNISWSKSFLNEDLTINLGSSHTWPGEDWIFLAQTDYKINDQLKAELTAVYLHIKNEGSALWPYRHQNQLNAKLSYQF